MKNLKHTPESEAAKWAEAALHSVDGISRVPANPFLYTRVMAALEGEFGAWEKAARFISKPAFAFAAILLFVATNIGVVFYGHQQEKKELAKKTNAEQMLAAEFSYNQSYALVETNEDK